MFEKALENGNFIDCEISDVTNAILDGASGLILKDCYDTDLISAVLKGINDLCYTIEPLTISKTRFRNLVNKVNQNLALLIFLLIKSALRCILHTVG